VSAAAHPVPEESTPLGSRPKPELVGRPPAIDLVRAERAVADLLAALGQDPTSEELAETPRRVAASYAELLTPAPFTLTSFPNDEGYDELVLARAIPFSSLCQHHLLPFTGVAHVGYHRLGGSWGCPSWPGWSSGSPAACSFRSGSPPRSPTGSRPNSSPRAWGCCWRPSTSA
jgi:hypothetical protein